MSLLCLHRRFPCLTYFLLGCLIMAVSFGSYDIIRAVGLGGPVYDAWPAWVKTARDVIGYIPWIALAGMRVARLYRGSRVRLFSFAGGLATPYVALVTFLFLWPPLTDHWHRRDFDAAGWHAAVEDGWSDWPVRLTMADDLVASGTLREKTREEVVALLGPPTETAKFATWDMVYYLGPERGLFRIDSEWLVLKFGADGRAREIRLVRD